MIIENKKENEINYEVLNAILKEFVSSKDGFIKPYKISHKNEKLKLSDIIFTLFILKEKNVVEQKYIVIEKESISSSQINDYVVYKRREDIKITSNDNKEIIEVWSIK